MTFTLDATGHQKLTPGIPRGLIVGLFGSPVPDGWALCDGTLGTPDLTDRFVIGDDVISEGIAGGTVSATSALTHSGAAVGNHSAHAVTQPSAHASHVVTQPSNHSDHVVTQAATHSAHASQGAHTHDAHGTSTATAGATSVIQDNFTHSSDGGHTHDAHPPHSGASVDAHSVHLGANLDAHSVHSGAALDAHSVHGVTQPSTHAVIRHYVLAYVMKL